ncbi:MAG: hypothetical protein EBR82_55030 [Caulobacteraceae bacterium]|jgi:peptidoglycan L-alanyl-D-glutamate endopeptidase CwlK|nr:hypothetical protein [Caulobacteraceae bacterium]
MTLRQAQERSLGHIKNLEKGFQKKVAEWFKECWSKKLYVLIYCSSRTQEEQEELYKKGRSLPGPKVTNARGYPPQSLHIDQGEGARAIDFVPLAESRTGWTAAWDDEESYEIAHKIAKAIGGLRRLDWETPHLEDASVKGWRELISPQKETEVKKEKKSIFKKNPWSSR